MTMTRPLQEFYSIGDECAQTDLKPHVLRYWESQFRFLNPAKNRSGNRVYQRREIELILLVKHLLYTELLHAQPLADGHGECIHAQADGDKQQFNKTH